MKGRLLSILILSTAHLIGQALKWHPLESYVDNESSWCPYSSTILENTYFENTIEKFDYIENPVLSTFNLSGGDNEMNGSIKSHLVGLRGNISGQPILIIDSDMDLSLIDEKVIFLPQLEKDESIPYEQFDFFPSDINYNHELTYEVLVDGSIHSKTSNIGITVKHYLDKASGELKYDNKFSICFNQKLQLRTDIDGHDCKLTCYDFFPWISAITFNINTDSINKRVDIKTPFTLKKNDSKYIIDSLDLINNKILIGPIKEIEKLQIQGESLYSDDIIKMDTTGTQLLHFWGSWCAGCIKNFPKLVELEKQHPDIELIGICQDRSKEPALKTAEKFNLNWQHIYFDFDDDVGGIGIDVLSYPTYILIKDNAIIERFKSIQNLIETLKK